MNLTTKGDLVLAALRKIGIASNATLTDVEPQSVEDGVNDLEMMMAEWREDPAVGIDIGYQFAAEGEPAMDGDDHGLKTAHLSAVYHNLAMRIAPDYQIEPLQKVATTARYGKELLVKSSALTRAKKVYRDAGYPNRMPIGSGNRIPTYNGHYYFHRKGDEDADDPTTSS
ncbi:packaged DNA stabilization gp4 family protein [Serratia ficaria]|uniref:packaged DNA stabilization gp4 family protein n=1 Tax=Serratia ficaria TaxID=61651 RepID=UPI00217B899D|nr:packaged DNA stabilization gp4 family protein [Serratia ficaria]CAI1024097.1 P22 tail accessory factor [Serratia ficaria]CAI1990110.1 P22 tail accessory factor [Serratia ficaria]